LATIRERRMDMQTSLTRSTLACTTRVGVLRESVQAFF